MEGMEGLKFTPVVRRHLLGPPRVFGPTSCTLTHLRLPTLPHYSPHPPPTHPPLILAIHDITVVVNKVDQNPAVLAS